MGTAIKHPVQDRVKPSFVILTSGHFDAQGWTAECPDVKNYKCRLNLVWHPTQVATVGVQGLSQSLDRVVSISECEVNKHRMWINIMRVAWRWIRTSGHGLLTVVRHHLSRSLQAARLHQSTASEALRHHQPSVLVPSPAVWYGRPIAVTRSRYQAITCKR